MKISIRVFIIATNIKNNNHIKLEFELTSVILKIQVENSLIIREKEKH